MLTDTQVFERVLSWFTKLFLISEGETHYHIREKDERGFMLGENERGKMVAICGCRVYEDTGWNPDVFGKEKVLTKGWCPVCERKMKGNDMKDFTSQIIKQLNLYRISHKGSVIGFDDEAFFKILIDTIIEIDELDKQNISVGMDRLKTAIREQKCSQQKEGGVCCSMQIRSALLDLEKILGLVRRDEYE